jgi:hypothetical protein
LVRIQVPQPADNLIDINALRQSPRARCAIREPSVCHRKPRISGAFQFSLGCSTAHEMAQGKAREWDDNDPAATFDETDWGELTPADKKALKIIIRYAVDL